MMKRRLPFAILLASFVMVSPGTIRADELKLKDGTKIVGTIVGFEENSFKVKTNYGFAVVQKDQVLSISITDSAKKPDPSAAKPAPPATVNSYKKSNAAPAAPPSPEPAVAAAPAAPNPKASPSDPPPPGAASATAKPVTPAAAPASAPAQPPAPAKPTQPESMRE